MQITSRVILQRHTDAAEHGTDVTQDIKLI